MSVLLEILSVLLDVPSFQPTEDEIGRNIRALKKYAWFRAYYDDARSKQLIIHNRHVRMKIGRFRTKRLENPRYEASYERKVERLLRKYTK